MVIGARNGELVIDCTWSWSRHARMLKMFRYPRED